MNETARLKKRDAALAAIPCWYNPWIHLAVTSGLGAAVVVAAVLYARDVLWWEWLLIPFIFLWANWFEWRVHKYILHRRVPGLGMIYEQHTPMHHGIYTTETLEIASAREMKLILIPASGIAGIVVAAAPPAYLIGHFVTENAGWIYLAVAGSYMTFYELTHLAYHLPRTNPIGRLPLVAALKRHHAKHHDLALMQAWNFNVSIPLWDWLLGTTWKEPGAAQK